MVLSQAWIDEASAWLRIPQPSVLDGFVQGQNYLRQRWLAEEQQRRDAQQLGRSQAAPASTLMGPPQGTTHSPLQQTMSAHKRKLPEWNTDRGNNHPAQRQRVDAQGAFVNTGQAPTSQAPPMATYPPRNMTPTMPNTWNSAYHQVGQSHDTFPTAPAAMASNHHGSPYTPHPPTPPTAPTYNQNTSSYVAHSHGQPAQRPGPGPAPAPRAIQSPSAPSPRASAALLPAAPGPSPAASASPRFSNIRPRTSPVQTQQRSPEEAQTARRRSVSNQHTPSISIKQEVARPTPGASTSPRLPHTSPEHAVIEISSGHAQDSRSTTAAAESRGSPTGPRDGALNPPGISTTDRIGQRTSNARNIPSAGEGEVLNQTATVNETSLRNLEESSTTSPNHPQEISREREPSLVVVSAGPTPQERTSTPHTQVPTGTSAEGTTRSHHPTGTDAPRSPGTSSATARASPASAQPESPLMVPLSRRKSYEPMAVDDPVPQDDDASGSRDADEAGTHSSPPSPAVASKDLSGPDPPLRQIDTTGSRASSSSLSSPISLSAFSPRQSPMAPSHQKSRSSVAPNKSPEAHHVESGRSSVQPCHPRQDSVPVLDTSSGPRQDSDPAPDASSRPRQASDPAPDASSRPRQNSAASAPNKSSSPRQDSAHAPDTSSHPRQDSASAPNTSSRPQQGSDSAAATSSRSRQDSPPAPDAQSSKTVIVESSNEKTRRPESPGDQRRPSATSAASPVDTSVTAREPHSPKQTPVNVWSDRRRQSQPANSRPKPQVAESMSTTPQVMADHTRRRLTKLWPSADLTKWEGLGGEDLVYLAGKRITEDVVQAHINAEVLYRMEKKTRNSGDNTSGDPHPTQKDCFQVKKRYEKWQDQNPGLSPKQFPAPDQDKLLNLKRKFGVEVSKNGFLDYHGEKPETFGQESMAPKRKLIWPAWYSKIKTQQLQTRVRGGGGNIGVDAKLGKFKALMRRCAETEEKDRGLLFDDIRKELHQLVFLEVNEIAVRRAQMLHEGTGLPQIFAVEHSKGVNYPWDLQAGAFELYNRWWTKTFSVDLLRGIVRSSKNNRATDRIEPGFAGKSGAAYHGQGDLVNGQWWPTQLCTVRDGAHGSTQGGIYAVKGKPAYSIIVSGGSQYNDRDEGDELWYSGTYAGIHSSDGKYSDNTQSLILSVEEKKPVRVIRSHNMHKRDGRFRPLRGFRYDGLYDVVSYDVVNEAQGGCLFHMVRRPGQDPIRAEGISMRPTGKEIAEYDKIKKFL